MDSESEFERVMSVMSHLSGQKSRITSEIDRGGSPVVCARKVSLLPSKMSTAEELARKKARLAELRKAKEQRLSLAGISSSSAGILSSSAAPSVELELRDLLAAAGEGQQWASRRHRSREPESHPFQYLLLTNIDAMINLPTPRPGHTHILLLSSPGVKVDPQASSAAAATSEVLPVIFAAPYMPVARMFHP